MICTRILRTRTRTSCTRLRHCVSVIWQLWQGCCPKKNSVLHRHKTATEVFDVISSSSFSCFNPSCWGSKITSCIMFSIVACFSPTVNTPQLFYYMPYPCVQPASPRSACYLNIIVDAFHYGNRCLFWPQCRPLYSVLLRTHAEDL